MSYPTENPFASPQTGPEDYDPTITSDVPPMPEVRRGVTLVYAGLLGQLLLGIVMGIGGMAIGIIAARQQAQVNLGSLQAFQLVAGILALLPAVLFVMGPSAWLSAPNQAENRSTAKFSLTMFAIGTVLALIVQVSAIGGNPFQVRSIAAVPAIFNYLGWWGVASYIGQIAAKNGLGLMVRRARSCKVLTSIMAITTLVTIGVVLAMGPGAALATATTAAPGTPTFAPAIAILGMVSGIISLLWLIFTARMLHFMRKAIPVA